jgi:hypothetical protein
MQLVNTPESLSINKGNIETSRVKHVSQQHNDGQNRNHVSMFSITSVGVNNKGNGSEVSISREHLKQNEQNQLMSNANNLCSNMNPSSVTIKTQ